MNPTITEEQRAELRREQKRNRAAWELEQIAMHARFLLESDTMEDSIDHAHGGADRESARQYNLHRVRLFAALVRLVQVRQAEAPIEEAWEALDELYEVLTYTTEQLKVNQ